MAKSLLYVIEEKRSGFSKGQRRIADYILNHYEKAAYMTASKLGNTVGVSESTVVRFAFELGYDGYPHMQKQLQEMIKHKLTAVQRIEVADEQLGDGEVLDKVLNLDIEKIRQTLEDTDRAAFGGAVDAIVSARKVYIQGARSASTLGRFLSFYFQLILPDVCLIEATSISEIFEQILRMNEQDVIIGISFPRYSTRTVSALQYAKSQGSKVIAITDSADSPLAQTADYFLQARSDMASFVDSLVAPLSLINALIVAVGLKKSEELKETFARLERIWEEYDVYQKSDAGAVDSKSEKNKKEANRKNDKK